MGDNRDYEGIGRSYFRNYAREFVLNDGTMGVDHYDTYNSNPIDLS